MRAGPSAAAETFLPMPLLVDCLSASSALRVLNDNALFKSTHSKSVYTLQPVKMHTFSDTVAASSRIARRLGPLLPELFQPALDINDVHDWPFNRL